MINYLREEILTLSSYQVPPSNNMLKLDAMESPFTPNKEGRQALSNLQNIAINRYPHNHDELKTTIKQLMSIDDELDIMLGNGSDELIQILMLGLKKSTQVVSFAPSFVMYEMIAKWCNLEFVSLDLNEHYDIDIARTLEIIDNNTPQILFLAYPNNPTGNCFDKQKIQRILATNTLVIIDEAYYAYAENSFIDEIKNYDNLIVLRTISKIGFAGLRLGVMIGNKTAIAELNKMRMPYNINSLTLEAATHLLSDVETINKRAVIIIKNRAKIYQALTTLGDITPYPSDANFILFTTAYANELFEFLKEHNILIKNMTATIAGGLRVNVSTEEENNHFLTIVRKFYE